MLQLLAPLKVMAEESVQNNLSNELHFDKRTQGLLLSAYQQAFPDYPAILQDNLIKITNKKKQTAYLPFNWFVRIKCCRDLINALTQYSIYIDGLKKILSDEVMRNLPKVNWSSSFDESVVTQIEEFIVTTFSNNDEQQRFRDFLDGKVWLDTKKEGSLELTGKKLNRQSSDYIASCITTICKLINDTAGKLEQFISIYIDNEDVRDLIDALTVTTETPPLISIVSSEIIGTNKIFYGAPGTGKSYMIEQGRDENYLIRTVFHPDTQYSDFVGCLKPIMNGGSVGYQFRPGPFTTAVTKAISDPTSEYFLVIEEINRAAAAAVFGEIFQLLDRDKNGESSYSIDVSDPDLLAYLNEKTLNKFSSGKLKIPSNLSLLATMNSSDQAVMPMDTAFKRRWQFKYLQIDYSKASKGTLNIPIESAGNITIQPIEWSILAMVINKHLATERIPEDRLLGHRFISETELQKDPDNTLKGKLLMYLWDDILRHSQKTIIFKDEVIINRKSVELINFSQLINAFEQGSTVFNNAIEESLLSKMAESVDTKTYLEYE